MAIQRVSDLDGEPVVGRFYLVPCVRHYGIWLPVIGPRHEDAKVIGFKDMHYHKDVRFLSDDWIEQRWNWTVMLSSHDLICEPEAHELTSVSTTEGEPVWRRMKCRRRMPEFPLAITALGRPAWQKRLERAYKGKSAKCGTCPHRGMPLKSLPVKDGKVICNGHGLQFDVNTGKMVPWV